MKRGGKILAVAGTIVAATLLLTGCTREISATTVAELPAYSLVQHEKGMFDDRVFGYIDSEGVEQPTECFRENIFAKRACGSADGLVTFSYTITKSVIRLKAFTVDGVERPMTKVYAHIEGISRVWVPSDKLEADQ